MLKVAVFLGSSPNASPMMASLAESLGMELAQLPCEIIYGGAALGLMEKMATAAMESGARVIGVIPEYDFAKKLVQKGLSEIHKVKSLGERKRQMVERADAFVVFPGGLGTLDEATDVLVMNQIGEIKKPVIFLNVLDYWTPLLESFDFMTEAGLMRKSDSDLFFVAEKISDVIVRLRKCAVEVRK